MEIGPIPWILASSERRHFRLSNYHSAQADEGLDVLSRLVVCRLELGERSIGHGCFDACKLEVVFHAHTCTSKRESDGLRSKQSAGDCDASPQTFRLQDGEWKKYIPRPSARRSWDRSLGSVLPCGAPGCFRNYGDLESIQMIRVKSPCLVNAVIVGEVWPRR